MKKWISITLVIIGLLIYSVVMLSKNSTRAMEAELWYVKNLDFHFSAIIDSLFISSKDGTASIYFYKVSGDLVLSNEDKLNEGITHVSDLRFILEGPDNKLGFHTICIDKYHKGDSIVINTDLDEILIYRHNAFVSKCEVSSCLSSFIAL